MVRAVAFEPRQQGVLTLRAPQPQQPLLVMLVPVMLVPVMLVPVMLVPVMVVPVMLEK